MGGFYSDFLYVFFTATFYKAFTIAAFYSPPLFLRENCEEGYKINL